MTRAVAVALLLGGCASAPTTPPITVPHGVLTDAASERLHGRCEVRGVRMVAREDVDRAAASADATFTEIVYQPNSAYVGVVLFRCPR